MSRSAFLLSFSLLSFVAEAAPWIREPGKSYLRAGATRFVADAPELTAPYLRSFETITASLWAEVGLPWDLEVAAELPYVVATNTFRPGGAYSNRTLGDARFQLARALVKSIPLSAVLETKVSLYEARHSELIQTYPDVGDGNVDLTPKLSIGHSFWPTPAWLTAELGYRLRLDKYADGVFGAFNAGGWVWRDRLALGVYVNGIKNVDQSPSLWETREWLYLSGYLIAAAEPWLKGVKLTLAAGFIPIARFCATGSDVTLSVSYEN